MADISLVTANKVNIVESFIQATLPAAEAIAAGEGVRLDVSTGKFTKANGTTSAEARIYGLATRTVVAGEGLTAIRKGVFDGFDVSALGYDADVFLSDTDGKLATAAGTVSTKVGRVISGAMTTLGTGLDKLLFVDL